MPSRPQSKNPKKLATRPELLPKSPTGIDGLDQITGGGLPQGRPTLICGGPGCGKTLFSMEFLIRGITQYNENAVFISFEEMADELAQNVRSLGFDVDKLIAQKKLAIDHIQIDANSIAEAGDFDLEGLFIRIGLAADSVKAKRIVLDTMETLFSAITNKAILRSELVRLFRWLKDRGLTAVITGERGEGQLTRWGIEEYVSDCVIVLDHRVNEQLSTRRLRIIKYRGTMHGTNEYPFLIQENGISVLPITSAGLDYSVSKERVSTGVPRLDTMFSGKGVYRGSSILVSGAAGTGKSSLAARFVEAACQRGERSILFAFEESPAQIMRNMRSIGIDLEKWVNKGLLKIHANRPTHSGLETHLVTMFGYLEKFKPSIVAVDPMSNFWVTGTATEVHGLLIRFIDYLKSNAITGIFTDVTTVHDHRDAAEFKISSMIDTWIHFLQIESSGERNRALYVLKSRGMAHSNQIREVLLSEKGIELVDVYLGSEGVLTGSMRAAQEAKERAAIVKQKQEASRQRIAIAAREAALRNQIAVLQAEFEALQEETRVMHANDEERKRLSLQERAEMGIRRGQDIMASKPR